MKEASGTLAATAVLTPPKEHETPGTDPVSRRFWLTDLAEQELASLGDI